MKKKKYSKKVFEVVSVKKKNFWFTKDKILLYIIGGILIMLMVSSSFWYGSDKEEEKEGNEYNGFNFVNVRGGWSTKVNNQDVVFEYAPWELENVSIEEFSLGSRVYVLFDPLKMNEESYDLQRMKGFLIFSGKDVNLACDKEKGCGDLPIKNCSLEDSVVYMKEGDEDRIYVDNNCVVVEGLNLLKVGNRFYYELLGVM